MAEQQTRPPDLSPTPLPQPSVVPAGCYTSSLPIGYFPGLPSGSNTNGYLHVRGLRSPMYSASAPDGVNPNMQPPTTAPHSIEDLLQGIWQRPGPEDPVTGMMNDRRDTHTLELGDVLDQIKERVAIYRQHFDELEQAKLDTKNVRHRWTDPIGRLGEVADPDLVSALQDIDAQQRQERLSCWKDLAALRQSVPEHWRLYLATVRQHSLLDGVRHDE